MFTKSKTVTTRESHTCMFCGKTIQKGTVCTYGVTTDPEHVGRASNGIYYGHICPDCRDIELNKK
jgi:hypothetical protein